MGMIAVCLFAATGYVEAGIPFVIGTGGRIVSVGNMIVKKEMKV